MRLNRIIAFTFGVLFVVQSTLSFAQGLTPEVEKVQQANTRDSEAASSGSGESKVDGEVNPALLEGGGFKAGRDPFENPFAVTAKVEKEPVVNGLPGMQIQEVTLTGIMSGAFGDVALFLAKDRQVYLARVNQKFANGRLAAIRKDRVVFEQDVVDEFGKRRPPSEKEVLLYSATQRGRNR